MRPITALLSAAALAIGLGGGTVAYRMSSAPAAPTRVQAVSATPTASSPDAYVRVRPGTRFRWAPCTPPAVRQGSECVTEVVRTVVVPAPAAAAPVAPPVTSPPAGARPGPGTHGQDGVPGPGSGGEPGDDQEADPSDDSGEDQGDDSGEDQGEDQGEDHGEDHGDDVALRR